MHPKILERREFVISEQLAEVDRELRAISVAMARRVYLAGSLCVGEDEAKVLEKQFQASVDFVIKTPALSEDGRLARRELITRLTELDDYLDSLFRSPWATTELVSRCRRNLNKCRDGLEQLKARR